MAKCGKYVSLSLVVTLALYSLLMVTPTNAQTETIATSCTISVDKTIEGQPIKITFQMFPAPPSGEVFSNISVGIVSPLQGISGNGPWDQKNIFTDSEGTAEVVFNIPTFASQANWNVWVYFGGLNFADNTLYYQQGYWEDQFFISAAQTPMPSPPSTSVPSLSPTSSPTVPEVPFLLLIPLLLSVLAVAVMVRVKKLRMSGS